MKLICEINVGGEDRLVMMTTATGSDLGSVVKNKPGVGKPYLMYNSVTIPAGKKLVAADFADALIVDADAAVNNTNISAALVVNPTPPAGVLTFADR